MAKLREFLIPGLVFLLCAGGGFLIFRGTSHLNLSGYTEVDWRLLGDLDYVTGQTSGELGKLDQQPVRIPGFMVPLEDDQKSVTEFLLVPTPQACIHMPPPPPNQMVLVRFPEGIPVAFGAIWVYGKLEIKSKRHEYGESSFQMEGATVEKYQN